MNSAFPILAGATAVLLAGAALADAGSDRGRALEQASCVACHGALFPDHPNRVYTRPDRKVRDLDTLRARVRGCAATNGVAWTAEDQADVVRYLNQSFYHLAGD